VEVPQIEYQDRYVEVPQVVEVVRRVPRVEVHEIPIERIIQEPKKKIEYIEQKTYSPVPRLVQQTVDRVIPVPVPQIETVEVVKQICIIENYFGPGQHGMLPGADQAASMSPPPAAAPQPVQQAYSVPAVEPNPPQPPLQGTPTPPAPPPRQVVEAAVPPPPLSEAAIGRSVFVGGTSMAAGQGQAFVVQPQQMAGVGQAVTVQSQSSVPFPVAAGSAAVMAVAQPVEGRIVDSYPVGPPRVVGYGPPGEAATGSAAIVTQTTKRAGHVTPPTPPVGGSAASLQGAVPLSTASAGGQYRSVFMSQAEAAQMQSQQMLSVLGAVGDAAGRANALSGWWSGCDGHHGRV
jgi:hypothetical protein